MGTSVLVGNEIENVVEVTGTSLTVAAPVTVVVAESVVGATVVSAEVQNTVVVDGGTVVVTSPPQITVVSAAAQGPPGAIIPIVGNDTEVLFKDGTGVSGSADFVFNKTLKQITLGGPVVVTGPAGFTGPMTFKVGDMSPLNSGTPGIWTGYTALPTAYYVGLSAEPGFAWLQLGDYTDLRIGRYGYPRVYFSSYAEGGRVGIGPKVTPSILARLHVNALSDELQMIVQGHTSQTANLQEWQNSSGTALASVTKDGLFLAPNGTEAAPSYAFAGDPTIGMFRASGIMFSVGNTRRFHMGSTGVGVGSADHIGFSSSTPYDAINDVRLYRDAAGVLAQRNGANAQVFNVYNRFTSDTDYERLVFSFGGGFAKISTESAGVGTTHQSLRLFPSTGGIETYHIYPDALATRDLGSIPGGRPWRQIFSGGDAAYVPFVARAHASQTANLQEWQNSSGTALASVTKDGLLLLPDGTAAAPSLSIGDVNSGFYAPYIYTQYLTQGGYANFGFAYSNFVLTSVGQLNWSSTGAATGLPDLYLSRAAAGQLLLSSPGINTSLFVKAGSAQAANLQEWQNSSGTALASVTKDGRLLLPAGDMSAPALAFVADPATGFYQHSATALVLATNGSRHFYFTNGLKMGSDGFVGWSDTDSDGLSAGDLFLYRDAAGVLAQRNGANPQEFRVYNDAAGAYHRLVWSGGSFYNRTSGAQAHYVGTNGSAPLYLQADFKTLQYVGGSLYPTADTVGALGTSANRYSAGYFGGVAATVPITIKAHASQTANLQEWQNSSGTALCAVSSAGRFHAGDGLVGSPTYSFLNSPGTGLWSSASNMIDISHSGVASYQIGSTYLWLKNNSSLLAFGAGFDTTLYRDAAGVLAQRNGANAQEFRLYNTYTGASNFERGGLKWYSSILYMTTEKAGTGTARRIAIIPAGDLVSIGTTDTARYNFDTQGVYPLTNVTYDLGVMGSWRWRSLNIGGAAATVPINVRAHASQTANLQEWQNSSGTALLSIKSTGRIGLNAVDEMWSPSGGFLDWVTPYAGTARFQSSQSGQSMAFQLLTSEGKIASFTHYDVANAKGRLFAISGQPGVAIAFSPSENELLRLNGFEVKNATSTASWTITSPAAASVLLKLKADASQTANLQEWQNSSGTALSVIDKDGRIGAGTSSPSAPLHVVGSTYLTGNVYLNDIRSYTSGELLVNPAAAGMRIIVQDTGFITTNNGNNDIMHRIEGLANSHRTIVRGRSGQDINLQEWQDSSGTPLASIDKDGALTTPKITLGAGPSWSTGSGTPESVVTAPVGSLFTRTDGGAATTLYVKESGSGNTGWIAK